MPFTFGKIVTTVTKTFTTRNKWKQFQLIMRTNSSLRQLSIKVALGVCFALKSWKEYLLLFTYLITLGKDVTLPLITEFKTNRPLSNLFVNRILN